MSQETIKVKATQLGYYEHKRRRAGDVFVLIPLKDKNGNVITARQQFSKKWMEVVPASTPERVSTMTRVDSGNLNEHNDINRPVHPSPGQVRFEANQPQSQVAEPAAQSSVASEEEVI